MYICIYVYISSFEPYPLELFATGLHLKVEFGCHRCHGKNGRHLSRCCCEAEDDDDALESEEDQAGFHMPRRPWMVDIGAPGVILNLRAGLRVCREPNELRLKQAHSTAQARCFMTLVHLWVTMFRVKISEKSVGKVNLLRTSCMSAFSRFSLVWSYINPQWNPNIVNCSMGPGNFMS